MDLQFTKNQWTSILRAVTVFEKNETIVIGKIEDKISDQNVVFEQNNFDVIMRACIATQTKFSNRIPQSVKLNCALILETLSVHTVKPPCIRICYENSVCQNEFSLTSIRGFLRHVQC